MTGMNVLLGAGFSKAVCSDFPTMLELTDFVRTDSTFSNTLRVLDYPHHLFVNSTYVNIENWIQTLENSDVYMPSPETIARRRHLVRIAENVILKKIREVSYSLSLSEKHLLGIGKLLSSNANILTTNYDLILEIALQELLTNKDSDSPYALNVGLFDLAFQRRNLTYLSGGELSETKYDSRIFKLHGSCDWFSHNPESDDKFWIDVSLLPNYNFEKFKEESRNNVRDMKAINALPSSSKNFAIGSMALKRIWKDAYKNIRGKEGLAIYGSSLNTSDGILNSLLSEALPADSPIFIWDPKAYEVKERAKLISPQSNITIFEDSNFEDFCSFVNSRQSA